MKYYIFLWVLPTMIFLSACGSHDATLNLQLDSAANPSGSTVNGASGGTNTNKVLASLWTEANNYYQLDLTAVKFGITSNAAVTIPVTGQNCKCQILVQGTESSGTANVSNCSGTYPNCNSFNSPSSTYTKANSVLQICTSSTSCTSLK